jgi:hypothetical protein
MRRLTRRLRCQICRDLPHLPICAATGHICAATSHAPCRDGLGWPHICQDRCTRMHCPHLHSVLPAFALRRGHICVGTAPRAHGACVRCRRPCRQRPTSRRSRRVLLPQSSLPSFQRQHRRRDQQPNPQPRPLSTPRTFLPSPPRQRPARPRRPSRPQNRQNSRQRFQRSRRRLCPQICPPRSPLRCQVSSPRYAGFDPR